MTCEISGKYRPSLQNFKRDDICSRKCECLIKLCAYMLANKKWRFNVICCLHNPDFYEKLTDHPIACRLILEEKDFISDMPLNLIQPKNILASLKHQRPEIVSNINQVYNIRYRTYEDGVTIRDIFWIHPHFINLFNKFPTVLIIDSLYKTNKYKRPLLEMVGVTSTEKTYSIGFAFLESEKEENVPWALEVFREMYHITKNVRSRVKPTVGKKQIKVEDGKMEGVSEIS
ncbi:uncharacterized protein LOC127078669 [Lathyrus oleraceus]|uniref:uncharacterized protein LOC127078669 n=1 Tax=Pisum sativum TaxID=3888 RepID=UPI0021CF4DD7|nr:uncharacterized protein LOC127078669 [Pisum sativum]